MFKEKTMYTVICNGCGKDIYDGTDYSCGDKESVENEIEYEDWITTDDQKHYCRDCYDLDDEGEIIITNPGPDQHPANHGHRDEFCPECNKITKQEVASPDTNSSESFQAWKCTECKECIENLIN